MQRVRETVEKIKKVRVRKIHVDYIAGLLSLPVLVTAIILNINSLRKKEVIVSPKPSPPSQVIIISQANNPAQVCKKAVGPVTISFPQEGQTVSDNPVCMTIRYTDPGYCSVVWSYRINTASWSEYSNTTPCLYNIPSGPVQFQIRVNSTASTDTKLFTRNFIFIGPTPVMSSTPVNTQIPTSTPLPTINTSPVATISGK